MTKEEIKEENWQRFLVYLARSSEGTMAIAKTFVDRGIDVLVTGIKKAPSRAEYKKYQDIGDMFIRKGNLWNKIETKRLSVNFTCKNDWRYKDKFIVCAKHSYDLAKQKANAYVISNDKMTHVAIVRKSSQGKWFPAVKPDSRYKDYKQVFYFCPIEFVEFRRMDETPDQT